MIIIIIILIIIIIIIIIIIKRRVSVSGCVWIVFREYRTISVP